MALTLTIKPPDKAIGGMPQEEIDRTPVLLGLDVEEIGRDVKLKACVVFQRIPVEAPPGMGPWFIAATQAQITLRANGAKITNYAKSRYIQVVYRIENGKRNEFKAELKPNVGVSETLSFSVFSLRGERVRSLNGTIECTHRESTLTALRRGDSVLSVRRRFVFKRRFATTLEN